MGEIAAQQQSTSRKGRVVISSPDLGLSGANTAVASIATGLSKVGWEVDWVVTGYAGTADAAWLDLDKSRLHVMPATAISDIKTRQRNLISFVNERAPCVYIPNFDFDMACASPALRNDIRVAFIVHSDDPAYYSFLDNHRHLCDAYITVSEYLDREIKSRYRDLRASVVRIPFGVSVPNHYAPKPVRDRMRIVYAGRISQYQKRIFDLADVINQSHVQSYSCEFYIAGDGTDRKEFIEKIHLAIESGVAKYLGKMPHSEITALLQESDVLMLTSEFEGLPIILLEAMAHGCIPVVTNIQSGISEVVKDGVTGTINGVGNIQQMLESINRLALDERTRALLGRNAHQAIADGPFDVKNSIRGYRRLLEALSLTGALVRPKGHPCIPRQYQITGRLLKYLKTLAS